MNDFYNFLKNDLKIYDSSDSKLKKILDSEKSYASVLIPIVNVGDGYEILFEVRSQSIPIQPGEVCLPGGRLNENEINLPLEAAKRETEEELGLSEEKYKIFHSLSPIESPRGVIFPFAALVSRNFNIDKLNINPKEVESVFSVPIRYFIKNQPKIHKIKVKYIPDEDFPKELVPDEYHEVWKHENLYNVYFYQFENYPVIWGITARIIARFISELPSIAFD